MELQEQVLQKMSDNFDGKGMSNFGEDDDELQFSGRATSFATEHLSDNRYGIKIETGNSDVVLSFAEAMFPTLRVSELVNVDANDKSINTIDPITGLGVDPVLNNGVFLGANIGGRTFVKMTGFIGDHVLSYNDVKEMSNNFPTIQAVIDDGIEGYVYARNAADYCKVMPKDKSKSIRMFKKYVSKNASRVIGMIITSSENSPIFNEVLNIQNISPYKNIADRKIFFQDSLSVGQFVKDKIEIITDFQFDGDTIVYMTIPKNTKADITFLIGAVRSGAKALDKKAQKAVNLAAKKGIAIGPTAKK